MVGGPPLLVETSEGADSRVQHAGDSALRSMGSKNESNEHQLAEKLEKSEAGRKKLRQAIALLKEKLEATSQVLEVNESLRQEVDKERQRANTERKKAESEKLLREKIEKENLTIKEQFIQVLQRLDHVEDNRKADQSEVARIQSEVKEAVGGIRAALQAVEAAKGVYQTLERTLHAKVNGAVQSSTRASSVAQSGQATSATAQATALAAQSLAKTVQKEVQSLASQVATLQKQGSNLTLHISSLQQDSQLRGPCTPLNSPESGETNASLAATKERPPSGAVSPTGSSLPAQGGMVLSKSQVEKERASKLKDGADEGETLASLVAITERPPSGAVSPTIGLPPRGGMFLSRSQLQNDGVLKSQTSLPQPHQQVQPATAVAKKGSVAIITGLDSILSPAVNQPPQPNSSTGMTPSLYITAPSFRGQAAHRQGDPPPHKSAEAAKRLEGREIPIKRSLVRRGGADVKLPGSSKATDSQDARPVSSTAGAVAQLNGSRDAHALVECGTQSEGRPLPKHMVCQRPDSRAPELIPEIARVPTARPGTDTPAKLLKSITRMFEKETKNRSKMEQKLMELQGILESTSLPADVAQVGEKRKRGSGKKRGEGAPGKEGKKWSQEGKEPRKKKSKCIIAEPAASESEPPCPDTEEMKDPLQERGAQEGERHVSGSCQPPQGPLSEARCPEPSGAEESRGMDVDCQEVRDAPEDQGSKGVSDMNLCTHDALKEGTGWESDFESTDDDSGEDWWAKKVLLSPTLPDIAAPPCPPSTLCLQALQSELGVQLLKTTQEVASHETPCGTRSLVEQLEAKLGSVGTDEQIPELPIVSTCDEEALLTPKFGAYDGAQNMEMIIAHGDGAMPENTHMMSLQEISCFLDDLPNVTHPPSVLDTSQDFCTTESADIGRLAQLEETTLESSETKGASAGRSVDHFQTALATGQHGTFVPGEEVSVPSESEINDTCEIKRTLIESNSRPMMQQGVEGDEAPEVVEKPMLVNQSDEKHQFLDCSSESEVSTKTSAMLKSVEEARAVGLNTAFTGAEGTCVGAQGPQRCESFSGRVGTAFVETKKRLYEALNRKSACKVQTGEQLGVELAAVAADCNLSGEELLGLFALALVEIPMFWQHDDIPNMDPLPNLSADNPLMQVIALVEQVLSCKAVLAVLHPGHDGIDILLSYLQRFLMNDKLWTGGVNAGKALSPSSPKEHIAWVAGQHPGCACQEGTIARAKTGGKILAGLCQAHGKLDALEAFMYTSLRGSCCDTCWLLAVASSFASVCGNSIFPTSCGLITIQALRAILLELLKSVEGKMEKNMTNPKLCCESSGQMLPKDFHHRECRTELQSLQKCLGQQSSEGLGATLHHILVTVHEILTSSHFILPQATLPATNQGVEAPTGRRCSLATADLDEVLVGALRRSFVDFHLVEQAPAGDKVAQDRFSDVCRALELVSVQLGWRWTYNDLIVGHLWGLVTPGASRVAVVAVVHLLGVLGRLGVVDDGSELPGVDVIREKLCGVLQHAAFSEATQLAAAQALAHLSFSQGERLGTPTGSSALGPKKSIAIMREWYKAAIDSQRREETTSVSDALNTA